MKNIIFISAILLFSCNSRKEAKLENAIKETTISGEKYFEYDEIEYYQNEIKEDQIGELYDNQKKSLKDSLKIEVILGETPKSISDTNFIDDLKSFGYTKSNIKSKKIEKINEFFSVKNHSESYITACIYVYRDILIFKRKSKVIGIAKICFSCNSKIIVGTKSITEKFGINGDYELLKEILRGK